MNATDAQSPAAGWRAQLQLTFARTAARTSIIERHHRGPLLVQRPFYPEGDICHAYIIHPPGGVVGGDELQLQVEIRSKAHALLTTPAAAKYYRSDGRTAHLEQLLQANDSTLEWLPQESIFYPQADVRSTTRIELRSHAKFIGWEIACLGLPARKQRFDTGTLCLHLELWRDDSPLLIDRLRITDAACQRSSRWGLGGHEAIGTLLAHPATRGMVDAVRNLQRPGVEQAVTLVDEVLVCRALAAQGEPIKRAFIEIWQTLRPQLLERPAVLPRIWST